MIMKKLLYILSVILVFVSCEKRNSDFNISGDCDVLSIQLDSVYNGVVDRKARTIVVAIPEVYDEREMEITALSLSEGASANRQVGDRLNLIAPQLLRVTNGDVFLDYALSVKHDEARIISFTINGQYIGVINQIAHTISVQVPAGTNLQSLTPTITTTEGATLTPASGVAQDFSQPVAYTVTYGTASLTYTVTVSEMSAPHVLYVGLAATQQQLPIEEQTAVTWLLSNVNKSAYVSFADLKAGAVDLSECKVIWWHLHKDGGIDGDGQFKNNAVEAIAAADALKAYYQAGGSFFLTRYATYLPKYLGEADCVPNNCWGQDEDKAETVSGPWDFSIAGHTNHALWQNLIMKSNAPENVFTCDAGYRITNSTAQYHIGADWGGYDDRDMFRTKTGAIDIAGGNDAVVAWEYARTADHGAIVCIGSGCYDWYSVAGDAGTEYYHANIAKITENAINYLKGE
ncbi:MAG: DUF4960 domain-containing protein [Paludibacteraceae bacterium]|nr:DUF4960 domain-containing protein [Paludibacteraceae bacterium]